MSVTPDYRPPKTREELIDWFVDTGFFVPVGSGDPKDRATYERMSDKELQLLFIETHSITPFT